MAWTLTGNIKGPTGATGAAGATGPTGAAGLNAFNVTSGAFTVPAVGSTVTVTLNDASWVVVGQDVYVAGAGGVGQAGWLQCTAKTGNQITLLNPTPPPAIPNASNTTAGLMAQTSGLTTDYVGGDNACHDLPTAVTPTITAVRLRSFSAIGNGTFEVDARNAGSSLAVTPSAMGWGCDRWWNWCAGTLRYSTQQTQLGVVVPGTSFWITCKYLRFTLTTAQASLGGTDLMALGQNVEGAVLRGLYNDLHSIAVLCRSSVANLKFGITLQDPTTTRSLSKLASLGAANTWSLLTFANLPAFPPAGSFSVQPGTVGYTFYICLAAGSTYTAAANDTWQTVGGTITGANGQANFASSAVNSTFDLAFIQHCPGSNTDLIDKPFSQNLLECQRYFYTNYDSGIKPGTAGQSGNVGTFSAISTNLANWNGSDSFKQKMAKVPTMTVYNYSTGAINSVAASSSGTFAVSAAYASQDCFSGFTTSTSGVAGQQAWPMYTADTGW